MVDGSWYFIFFHNLFSNFFKFHYYTPMSKKKNVSDKISKDAILAARGWFLLGVSALAVAGLYAVILVFARADWFSHIIPIKDFFRISLSIHVNLSVLVWLLSFSGMMWAFLYVKDFSVWDLCAVITSGLGASIMAISPFVHDGEALLNNYIPVILNPVFFWGLVIFGMGIFIAVTLVIIRFISDGHIKISNPVNIGIFSSALMAVIAFLCFYLSYKATSEPDILKLLDSEQYFELLFWGGGHVLQFVYLQMVLVAWLVLGNTIISSVFINNRLVIFLFLLNLLAVLPSPYIYNSHAITDFEHKDFFTQQMRNAAGIAPLIIGFFVTMALFENWGVRKHKLERNALASSILLFAVGGIIGFMIGETNTTIPAHYHGSIVGITLAFMGVSYSMLPKLGYAEVKGKLAEMQPFIYGGGQLLHIIGLAVSGGYGALRKTPGAMESIEGKVSMGMMGLGGLLSIIGGLLFVIIVFNSIFKNSRRRK